MEWKAPSHVRSCSLVIGNAKSSLKNTSKMHLFKKLALDTIVQQKIRRKAKRALMISRTKEAILAADKIRIRYIPDRVMAIPKSAQLHSIKSIVAGHMVFPIDREKEYFRDKFLDSPLLNDIMIDMFWYCTAAFFQVLLYFYYK